MTEIIIAVFSAIGSGFGVYGAIRADLARAIAVAESAQQSSDKAHDRIDSHIQMPHCSGH